MKVIVDRFEADQSMINIPLKDLPKEVQPGVVVIIQNGMYRIDHEETKIRKQYIEKLANDLWG